MPADSSSAAGSSCDSSEWDSDFSESDCEEADGRARAENLAADAGCELPGWVYTLPPMDEIPLNDQLAAKRRDAGIQEGNLFIGSALAALDRELLDARGVTHLINAAPAAVPRPKHDQLKYMSIALTDDACPKNQCLFNQSTQHLAGFIDAALSEGGRVVVHCQCGINRASAIVTSYLILFRGWTPDRALSYVSDQRSGANRNWAYISSLRKLSPNQADTEPNHEKVVSSSACVINPVASACVSAVSSDCVKQIPAN